MTRQKALSEGYITFPISTRFVSITIVQQFSCQIIRQKSFNVSCVGPFKHNIKKTLQKAAEINSTLQAVDPTAGTVNQWRRYF